MKDSLFPVCSGKYNAARIVLEAYTIPYRSAVERRLEKILGSVPDNITALELNKCVLNFVDNLEIDVPQQNQVFKLTSRQNAIWYGGTSEVRYTSISDPVFVQLDREGNLIAEKDVLFWMRDSYYSPDEKYIYSFYPYLCELFRAQVDGTSSDVRIVKFEQRGSLEKVLKTSCTIIRVNVSEVMATLLRKYPQFLLALSRAEVIKLTDNVICNRKAPGWSALNMAKQFKSLCLTIKSKSTAVEDMQLEFFGNILSKEALLVQFNKGGWWSSQHTVAKERMLHAAAQVGLSSEEVQAALTLHALTKK